MILYLNSLNIQICVSQRNQESNGIGRRVVILRHTIMTSPTCALTQLFVPNNHRQRSPRRYLKSNTCVKRNFKHMNFNLFRVKFINQYTGDKYYIPGNIWKLLYVAKCVPLNTFLHFNLSHTCVCQNITTLIWNEDAKSTSWPLAKYNQVPSHGITNKLLPEPILTQSYVTIWHHLAPKPNELNGHIYCVWK